MDGSLEIHVSSLGNHPLRYSILRKGTTNSSDLHMFLDLLPLGRAGECHDEAGSKYSQLQVTRYSRDGYPGLPNGHRCEDPTIIVKVFHEWDQHTARGLDVKL